MPQRKRGCLMNNQQRKRHYRIMYRKANGSQGAYFIAEENERTPRHGEFQFRAGKTKSAGGNRLIKGIRYAVLFSAASHKNDSRQSLCEWCGKRAVTISYRTLYVGTVFENTGRYCECVKCSRLGKESLLHSLGAQKKRRMFGC